MPNPQQLLLVLPLIFLVAVLYSSVGHGGASGYLAVISLMGFSARQFVPIVLTLNVLVAGIAFLNYRRPGAFEIRKLLPFVITSIPASYIGGMLRVSQPVFEIILGVALLAAAGRLVLPKSPSHRSSFIVQHYYPIALPIGLILGFVSGMIGIGGGIFLSPILLFLGITDIKGSAAMASAFIVLNSLAGLAGHANTIFSLGDALFLYFLLAGLAGALLGSYFGATKSRPHTLQYALASVLVLAGLKLVAGAI
ncbi:MAG: sulfite exporter TauE/SafE family protein [Bacteroidota bacterium]|nr:sulfite exporter TauE/SafE family protein [Bacteroidota bacterium]MDP4232257.1 sulfite exporter TauE/SafE family protein [Bacteroidota bacterium]MDP4242659.1 sulfite exporter TauE/SafE family protein [Bacteroidota bacterium]MDP4286779.1 sulfite exporter TauE/SafE family protein [Bacteroidota bacterium]